MPTQGVIIANRVLVVVDSCQAPVGAQVNRVEYQVHGEDVDLHTQYTVTRAVSENVWGGLLCCVLPATPHDAYNIIAQIRHI